MTPIDQRIAQFSKMAADDPSNELGHFSLGKVLAEAGRHDEAVASFNRTLEINAALSKAYELKGRSLLALERRDEAIETLTAGVTAAANRGDVLPRDAMARLLGELGAPVPDFSNARSAEVGEGEVFDVRLGKAAPRLPRQPLRGPVGEVIYANIGRESWDEWIKMGTKVINELRLPLSDPQAQETYEQHMLDFLNIRDLVEAKQKA